MYKHHSTTCYKNLRWVKCGTTKTKADKMVFELQHTWLIIDIKELHNYLKITKTRVVKLEELEKCKTISSH